MLKNKHKNIITSMFDKLTVATMMRNKMKAALLYGPGDVRVEEVDVPHINDDQVLIRVRAVGICQSDIRVIKGISKKRYFSYGRDSYGLTGHEWSGEIVDLGKNTKGISIGDRVVPEIIISCGKCKMCIEGRSNLCINKEYIIRGYAEYAVAPYNHLYKIPHDIDFEEAALAEPLAVTLHANTIANPQPGTTVVIIGAGPMGLLNLMLSKLSGARVIVSDIIDERLQKAKYLGADDVINPMRENITTRLREVNDGFGADIVIVCASSTKAIENGINAVGSGGKLLFFAGNITPAEINIDPNYIHYNEITITGSYDHLPRDFTNALKLISLRKVNVKSIISHYTSLIDLPNGLEIAESRAGLKVMIKP
ncbi:MAG: alcohol dehydrogenase catalytic domain-containing protein [Nitrososphaerota archaeon]